MYWKTRQCILDWAAGLGSLAFLIGIAGEVFEFFSGNFSLILIIVGFITAVASSILMSKCYDDDLLKEHAEKGLVILLTYEQYLSLNAADPEKYPLKSYHINYDLGPSGSGNVKMLRKDRIRLLMMIEQKETEDKEATTRRECLEELKAMQQTLSTYIENQEKQNIETAKTMKNQAMRIIKINKNNNQIQVMTG